VPADYDLEVDELRAVAARDQTAFARWFARCEIPLKRSLQSFAELVDIECVVQDAGLKVWRNASRIVPDGRSSFLLRWTKTVALNDARTKIRRAGHRLDKLREAFGEHGFESVKPSRRDPLLAKHVQDCLQRLNPLQRLAFRARVEDKGARPDRELAAEIGMSFDAFRQNLARGRKALVRCLGSFNIDVMEYLR
jgi:DNA-directed RNA polymerase specialized sigma24 family protein